jgi:hypothetical protein
MLAPPVYLCACTAAARVCATAAGAVACRNLRPLPRRPQQRRGGGCRRPTAQLPHCPPHCGACCCLISAEHAANRSPTAAPQNSRLRAHEVWHVEAAGLYGCHQAQYGQQSQREAGGGHSGALQDLSCVRSGARCWAWRESVLKRALKHMSEVAGSLRGHEAHVGHGHSPHTRRHRHVTPLGLRVNGAGSERCSRSF